MNKYNLAGNTLGVRRLTPGDWRRRDIPSLFFAFRLLPWSSEQIVRVRSEAAGRSSVRFFEAEMDK
jgi:hypothetical protein